MSRLACCGARWKPRFAPAVVLSSDTYLVERPDVLVGILTTKLPRKATSTDYVLLDWQLAGLRAESCFRGQDHGDAYFPAGGLGQDRAVGHDVEFLNTGPAPRAD
jgi:hypothetical protein